MSERSNNTVLHLLSLAMFTMGTAALAAVGALQTISTTLHVARADAALLVTVFAITFAVSAPLIQVGFGHLPRRTLLLAGLCVMALGTLASALAPSYGLLVAARMLTGLGAAAVSPVASALGSSLVPQERQGHALAIVFSGMTAASVIGVPLSSWMAAQLGWRWMFAAIALFSFAAAGALARLVRHSAPGVRVRVADLLAVLRSADTAGGLAVMVLTYASLFTTYTMITPILRDRYGAGTAAVSMALLVYGVAGLAGNQVARRVATIWSSQRSLFVALFLMLAAFVVMELGPLAYALVLAVLTIWALAIDIFMPAQQRRMVELRPAMRGLVLALNSSALFVGVALGSFIAGQVTTHGGLAMLPVASLALGAAAVAVLAWSRNAQPRTMPA